MKLKERILGMKLNTKFTAIIILIVVFPIAILAGILFYSMEKNVVDENVAYMQYSLERNVGNIETNISSINMSTQFFLSDESLTEVLNYAIEDKDMTTEELLTFRDVTISSLERLVNSNPLLYCVRVYAGNDNVQEMMPVLYRNSRMQNLEWADEEDIYGWHYGYTDTTFSSLISNQEEAIASLVTPITDYDNGTIGTIEAGIKMRTMFPSLYENIDNEWSCFVTEDGNMYFGDNEKDNSKSIVEQVLKQKTDASEQDTYYTRIGKNCVVISYMPMKELGGVFISVSDITKEIQNVSKLRNMFLTGMVVILLALTGIINYLVKRMLHQFYEILKTVRKVQKGDLNIRTQEYGNDEMSELATQLNKMLDRIQRLMKDNINREILAKNSEIRALQNQINAHFIYNVLETIKMMAEIDEEYEISDAITSLGKLLRYSMKWVSGNVMLSEELEYVKNYMALINLRFDYEIYLSLNIPEMLMEQEIPKMSLQPVVENAILHGIEEMAEDTNIYIKAYVEREDCLIEITDAGKGMSPAELEILHLKIAGDIETTGGKGHGIGLKNVQDRITMAFGSSYGVEVSSKLGCYTKVTLRVPLKNGKHLQK